MLFSRLWERRRRGERGAAQPNLVDGGDIAPMQPWTPQEGVREVRHYTVRAGSRHEHRPQRDVLSGGLLTAAGLIIAASLVGAGYVSYESQRLFALKHISGTDQDTRAAIIAALPDAGWSAMALVALVAALRGRSSARARLGVIVFFGMSLAAQIMYAPRTVEGYLVAVIAPITLAWMLESFVVEVRRWAANKRGLELDEAPILHGILRLPVLGWRCMLWWIRLVLDRRGTWAGIKTWVLDEAPLAPGRTAASLRAAKAIEEAGSAQQEAERIKASALEEAERIKDAARQEAERTRQEAASQVEQARKEAAEAIEQARHEARTVAAEQVRQAEQRAQEQIERLRAEYEQKVAATAEERDQALRQRTVMAGDLQWIKAEYQRLLAVAPAKARLIAAYERLGADGDPRYMDRAAVAEVARELYEEAGLQSEGTARDYLYKHVDAHTKAPLNGQEVLA